MSEGNNSENKFIGQSRGHSNNSLVTRSSNLIMMSDPLDASNSSRLECPILLNGQLPEEIELFSPDSTHNQNTPAQAETLLQCSKSIQIIKGLDQNKPLLLSLDLDSLYGNMPTEVFKNSFLQNFTLSINSNGSYNPRIHTNLRIPINGQFLNVKSLPHVKLGSAKQTDFGVLDIFVYFTAIPRQLESDIKLRVYSTIEKIIRLKQNLNNSFFFAKMKKETDSYASIECILNSSDFADLLEAFNNHELGRFQPEIFIETYGNKKFTMSNSLSMDRVEKMIYSCFTSSAAEWLIVDVCISASYGSSTVTLANNSFFKATNLIPNYKPLFSDTLQNVYRSSKIPNDGSNENLGIFTGCVKLNFYSTFKYYLDFDDTENYILPMSASSIHQNFLGKRIFKNNHGSIKHLQNYQVVEQKAISDLKSGTCLYRSEIRCYLKDAEKLLESLKKCLKTENFDMYNSSSFFDILQRNICILLDSCNFYNSDVELFTDRIVQSIMSEYCLKKYLLSGSLQTTSKVLSEMDNLIAQKFPILPNGISVLPKETQIWIEDIVRQIPNERKLSIVYSQIDYCDYLSLAKKAILKEGCKLNVEKASITEESFLRTLLEILIYEHLDTDDGFLISDLMSETNDESLVETKISKILVKFFIDKDPASLNSTVSKVLFKLYQSCFNYSQDLSLQRLQDYFYSQHITRFFGSTVTGSRELVKLVYPVINEEESNQQDAILDRRSELLETLNSNITSRGSATRHFTEAELIRYLSCMFRHSNSRSRIEDSLLDFAYGFYPLRNYEWIKNKFVQLGKMVLSSQNNFKRTIKRVKEWSPDHYKLEDRVSDLRQSGFCLTEQGWEAFREITELSINEWWDSRAWQDIADCNGYDIFYSVVKRFAAYRTLKPEVLTWSRNPLDFTSPVERAIHEIRQYLPENFIRLPDRPSDIVDNYFEVEFDNNDFDFEPTDIYTPVSLNNVIEEHDSSCDGLVQPSTIPMVEISTAIKERIFSYFKYRMFTFNESRKLLFNKNTRPAIQEWSNIINSFENLKILSKISRDGTNYFKMNIQTINNELLTFDYIIKSVSRLLLKFPQKRATASQLRTLTKLQKRTGIDQWELYLQQLSLENFIQHENQSGIRFYYL